MAHAIFIKSLLLFMYVLIEISTKKLIEPILSALDKSLLSQVQQIFHKNKLSITSLLTSKLTNYPFKINLPSIVNSNFFYIFNNEKLKRFRSYRYKLTFIIKEGAALKSDISLVFSL